MYSRSAILLARNKIIRQSVYDFTKDTRNLFNFKSNLKAQNQFTLLAILRAENALTITYVVL